MAGLEYLPLFTTPSALRSTRINDQRVPPEVVFQTWITWLYKCSAYHIERTPASAALPVALLLELTIIKAQLDLLSSEWASLPHVLLAQVVV